MKEKPAVEVRLDKWLWAARFYKTRALAREMIEGGKVHYNGQRSRPSASRPCCCVNAALSESIDTAPTNLLPRSMT